MANDELNPVDRERLPTSDTFSRREEPPGSTSALLRRILALFGTLQIPLVLGAFLLVPATVHPSMPGHDLFGGMFSGMTPWEVFVSTIAYVGAAWTLMFVIGLLIEGAEARHGWGRPFLLEGDLEVASARRFLPAWSLRFFTVPASWPQLMTFTALTLPGVAITVVLGHEPWWCALAALAGIVVAYLSTVLITAPVYAVSEPRAGGEPYLPLPDRHLAPLAWRLFSRWHAGVRWTKSVQSAATWLFARSPFRDVIDPRSGLLHIDHFFALMNGTYAFVLLMLGRWLFEPPVPKLGLPTLPSAALVFALLVFLIYLLGALTFHLRPFHVSGLLVLLGICVFGYSVTGQDEYYRVARVQGSDVRIGSLDVVRAGAGKNLVVVTATGGGIAAAAWTTLALTRLVEARPELSRELRLISAVSGGAVGSAFLLDELQRSSLEPPAARFERAYRRATRSSLPAVAHGLVFSDVFRLLSGGLVSFGVKGRGELLELEWQFAAQQPVPLPLSAFVPAIREGRMPAVIFNTTVMETGRRVMVTPMRLPGPGAVTRNDVAQMAGTEELPPRAQTLDEYLFGGGEAAAEVSLWTGARLAATFPYVTPAARAEANVSDRNQAGHHLIDGGYYDNYGVASALEWLEPVLVARLRRELSFERVAIVQVRVGHPSDPADTEPVNGALAALAGPVIGVLGIRDGAAVTRNETELSRFISAWNSRLGPDRVELRTFVLQPKEGERYPLSWHLTPREVEELERRWPKTGTSDPIRSELARLLEFLAD